MSPDQIGFTTLLKKEVMRFWSVLAQTVTAPVITAVLYLLVFAQAMSGRASAYEGVTYTQFLLPGLIMMAVIQNAFANTSSSMIQSKMMGNIVFILMSPIGPVDMFLAYVAAALLRVTCVAIAMLAVTMPFVHLPIEAPLVLIGHFFFAAGSLAVLGLIAGITAQKFDHIATFTNFVIMPASFLSGVFYSVHSLPPFWFHASHLNPFFFMIDGFRYGFFGRADVAAWVSLLWSGSFFVAVSILCLWILKRGWRLRN